MLSGFSFTQGDCIRLLPLLFHINHPMLPGYVDKSTACGIPNYFPSNLENKIAKTVSRGFEFSPRAYLKFEIAGLYLMGSTGTLGQSVRSDLDLWVCMAEHLPDPQLIKLHAKTQLISRWFASKGIELNCYLVHEDDFSSKKSKTLSGDSCGDTQNFLLLDEFYRTAVWLCGRQPIWWLVPPENHYQSSVEQLLDGQMLEAADWIDFGEVAEIPASEYFSAALWQLYKAIDSPYKSSVKLLVLEIYARCFPKSGLLSNQFKTMVYQGEDDPGVLDPYLMILQFAEKFLKQQPQRLEFLRRAFYLKSGSKIQLSKRNPKNWRYQQIFELVERWEWKQARLDYLNNRLNWRINAVISERDALVRELTHSYHFLSNFARVQGVLDSVSQNELNALGRKLYAAFERRAGKIDKINNGIARNVTEASITLEQKESGQWCLFLGSLSKNLLVINQPVYRADSFFELIAWCACNLVVDRNSNYQVYSKEAFFSREHARHLVRDLTSLTAHLNVELTDQNFQRSAQVIKTGIYLNIEQDPLADEKSRDIYTVTGQSDGFCWGDHLTNLFAQFNIFYLNSWGEYCIKSYRGNFAWIQFVVDQQQQKCCDTHQMVFFCGDLPLAEKAQQRLLDVFECWSNLLTDSRTKNLHYRYLMSVGGGFVMIDFDNARVDYQFLASSQQLLYRLSETSYQPIEYVLDENIQLSRSIKKVIKNPPEGARNCYFIQHKKDCFEVIVSEPNGNIFYQQHVSVELARLMSHYQQFFDSVCQRFGFSDEGVRTNVFWLIDDAAANSIRKIKPNFNQLASYYSKVQAIATINSEQRTCFDLFFDEQTFYYRDLGDLVYRNLAQYILNQRNGLAAYPIFITDLDLSVLNQPSMLIDYLAVKRGIEQELNRWLSRLSH